MRQSTTIQDLTDDARFEIIKYLDFQSIDNLCRTNKLFRQFCTSFEGDIYKYLLQRDYGIDIDRDISRVRYLQARSVQTLTLKRLRESGISIFADMLELECVINPTGRVHQLFTSPAGQVIIAPTDTTMTEYIKSVIYLSQDEFHEKFNNLLLQNHIGVFDRNQNQFDGLRFNNLNGIAFMVSTVYYPLVPLGNISGIELYSGNRIILTQEQHDSIVDFFREQMDYETS